MANLGLEITSGLSAITGGIAHILDTVDDYTSGKLLSFRNDAVEKAFVDFEGSFSGHDGLFGGRITVADDSVISGLTVGRGLGAQSSNTTLGASALSANTSGAFNAALGDRAL